MTAARARSQRSRRASATLTVLLLALAAFPSSASARQTKELRYPFAQVWGTAVRLLRVDYGFPIRDRDEEIGYVLFDYVEAGRTYQGSVEIVRATGPAAGAPPAGAALELPGVRVMLHIPSMPTYVERMILDRLERKLREDFGLPVERRRPARPAAPREGDEAPVQEGSEEGRAGDEDEGGAREQDRGAGSH